MRREWRVPLKRYTLQDLEQLEAAGTKKAYLNSHWLDLETFEEGEAVGVSFTEPLSVTVYLLRSGRDGYVTTEAGDVLLLSIANRYGYDDVEWMHPHKGADMYSLSDKPVEAGGFQLHSMWFRSDVHPDVTE